jgi:uncharacterized protein
VKLVREERETDALIEELTRWPERISSVVGAIEVRRAGRRATHGDRADAVIAELALLPLDERVVQLAVSSAPELRTLDAIHLATALTIRGDLAAFCCYDRRLSEAAAGAGLTVVAPGM